MAYTARRCYALNMNNKNRSNSIEAATVNFKAYQKCPI